MSGSRTPSTRIATSTLGCWSKRLSLALRSSASRIRPVSPVVASRTRRLEISRFDVEVEHRGAERLGSLARQLHTPDENATRRLEAERALVPDGPDAVAFSRQHRPALDVAKGRHRGELGWR